MGYEHDHQTQPSDKVFNRVSSSSAAGHTQELTIEQLRTLCRAGMVG